MENITNNDINKYNKVFDYFLLMGIDNENIKDKTMNEIVNMNPTIQSHFPNINNPVLEKTNLPVISQVIFPTKADYIRDIKDFTNPEIIKPCFEDYIVKTRPKN